MELLKELYTINSKSGKEDKIKKFILSYICNIPLHIETDEIGNLFITKGNVQLYPCVVAHLDEVHELSTRIIIEIPPIVCAVNEVGERVGVGADDKNGIWIALKLLEKCENIKVALFVERRKRLR